MATHSSTLAWKIPWIEEPGRLESMGHRVGHDWALSFHFFLPHIFFPWWIHFLFIFLWHQCFPVFCAQDLRINLVLGTVSLWGPSVLCLLPWYPSPILKAQSKSDPWYFAPGPIPLFFWLLPFYFCSPSLPLFRMSYWINCLFLSWAWGFNLPCGFNLPRQL